jgi:hypothetical protein
MDEACRTNGKCEHNFNQKPCREETAWKTYVLDERTIKWILSEYLDWFEQVRGRVQ